MLVVLFEVRSSSCVLGADLCIDGVSCIACVTVRRDRRRRARCRNPSLVASPKCQLGQASYAPILEQKQAQLCNPLQGTPPTYLFTLSPPRFPCVSLSERACVRCAGCGGTSLTTSVGAATSALSTALGAVAAISHAAAPTCHSSSPRASPTRRR
eukprot:2514405-Pleurochrysis_carterae.AAC.2